MMENIQTLLADLQDADFNVRALALAEIVEAGRAVAPDLVAALPDADTTLKPQLAQALAEIAEPGSADALAGLLDNQDERVRAFGALGLARIGDPRAQAALIRTIDDFADVLSAPYTLSTYALIDQGPAALTAVLPLLEAASATTRAHAFVVIHDIVSAEPDTGNWPALWRQLGSYTADGPEAQRHTAARLWADWIGERFGKP
ncbi:MAG: HEAT repeat domain-containing protein [Zoogloea sp.]|nr:HEAT repeat domain-containing protein [Zoogloea sp.]